MSSQKAMRTKERSDVFYDYPNSWLSRIRKCMYVTRGSTAGIALCSVWKVKQKKSNLIGVKAIGSGVKCTTVER